MISRRGGKRYGWREVERERSREVERWRGGMEDWWESQRCRKRQRIDPLPWGRVRERV